MSAPSCSACLGTRKCWVCEGTGRVEVAPDRFQPCSRCRGSGVCTECQADGDARVPARRREAVARATLEITDDYVRIRAYGEFDIDSATTLSAALDDAAGSGVSVVLDLAETTFLDMYALRFIVQTTHRLAAEGRTLRIVNASALIARLFQATDLTDLLSA